MRKCFDGDLKTRNRRCSSGTVRRHSSTKGGDDDIATLEVASKANRRNVCEVSLDGC